MTERVVYVTPNETHWASTRLRAAWPAKHMDNASVTTFREANENGLPEADAYVFVKLGDVEPWKQLRAEGKQVWWDVCDPAWWWSPAGARELADAATGVVASCVGLEEDFNEWYGTEKAVCIPDRIDLEHYPIKRIHAEVSPVRFIWFGAAQNRISLFGALANMERLAVCGYNISLTIFDDKPHDIWSLTKLFPVYHLKWSLDHENAVIASHDVALLPEYPGPWGQVKSNNKQLTAWACGLPVVTGTGDFDALEGYMDVEQRKEVVERGRIYIDRYYDVRQSAEEWEALLWNR